MVIDHEPTRLFSGPGRRNGQVYALGESHKYEWYERLIF